MYLYENPEWTDFRWDDSRVAPLLADVRFEQGRLLGRVKDLGFHITGVAEADLLTDEIVDSFEIEGIRLDAQAVRSSVARLLGIEIAPMKKASALEDGAVSLIADATSHYAERMSRKRLLGWNAALFPTGFSGLSKIKTGAYRSDDMQVVSGGFGHEKVHFQAPPPSEVDGLMRAFIDWLNNNHETDPVMKAAIAHLWFLTIHPFDDGNGRIARALTEMLLARSDRSSRRFYTMSAQILKRQTEYYDVVEMAQKGTDDITMWIEWFLITLKDSLLASEQRLDSVLQRARFWQNAQNLDLNGRQRAMLMRVLGDFEGKLTAAKWAKMMKVSHDTALRDDGGACADCCLRAAACGRSDF